LEEGSGGQAIKCTNWASQDTKHSRQWWLVWEFHQTRGSNIQTVKPGAVVLVHNDTPCINWQLAVIEDTISGEDGLVRAANIRTLTGWINRPITKLYPLEVTISDSLLQAKNTLLHQTEDVSSSWDRISVAEPLKDRSEDRRPVRQATLKARQQVKEWAEALCAPPGGCQELVTTTLILIT